MSRDARGWRTKQVQPPTKIGEMLAQAIDPRLAEVWLEVFAAEQGDLEELLPWLLRMAYLCGHRDAQESPDALFRSLGVQDSRRKR